jgi:hypothetical protein
MGRGQDRSHREPLLSAYQEPLGADVVHHVRHAAIAPLDPVHVRPFGVRNDFASRKRSSMVDFRGKYFNVFNVLRGARYGSTGGSLNGGPRYGSRSLRTPAIGFLPTCA